MSFCLRAPSRVNAAATLADTSSSLISVNPLSLSCPYHLPRSSKNVSNLAYLPIEEGREVLRQLSVFGKTHECVAEAAIEKTLSHQSMCRERSCEFCLVGTA